MDLLDLAYYFSLFSLPFVVYILCLKERRRVKYSRPAWYHSLKKVLAKGKVKKLQEQHRDVLQGVTDEEEERPRLTLENPETDSQVIYGADLYGNSLVLRISLKHTLHAELSLELKLNNGKNYRFPGEPEVLICSISVRQWKAHGLTLQVLEPFQRLRITFNGLLDNGMGMGQIEHVQFHFLWNAASAPFYYPQDVSSNLLCDAIAREPWKDGDWIHLLGNECGYEQFGALQGFIKGPAYEEDLELYMPSWRRRHWGLSDATYLTRDAFIFAVLKDGTVFAIGAKSLQAGCTHIRYGTVVCSNGLTYEISQSDINLEHLADHGGEVPDALTVHFDANGRTFKCVAHLRKDNVFTWVNNEERGFKQRFVTAECDVDSTQATAIISFWYQRQGKTDSSLTNQGNGVGLPEALLNENKSENPEDIFITALSEVDCTDPSLTGGKGTSLALLTTLKDPEFEVPTGFVVTITSFRHQLRKYPALQAAVENLAHACYHRKENIEELCKNTSSLFTKQEVDGKVAKLILNAMRKVVGAHRWAVRSSAVGEDSDELSAAGQNSTFLGCVTATDVLKAVSACWGSLFTFQSVQYRRQHGMAVNSEMAVVVQRMVPSDSAGVLFTCHPVTGDPSRMIITSNYGLGESVVSGSADPDTIVLSRTWNNNVSILSYNVGAKRTQINMKTTATDNIGTEETQVSEELVKTLSISEVQALKLGKIGLIVQERFGNPRDIEWAFHKDKLYLLQSRPITTLNTWTDFELLHEFDTPILTERSMYTRANVGEVLKGALTVLTQSTIAKHGVEHGIQYELMGKINKYVRKIMPLRQHFAFLDVLNNMYSKVLNKITMDLKVLDLAIFGHVVINEKLHREAIRRHGAYSTAKNLHYNLELAMNLWENQKILAAAQKLSETMAVDFEEKDRLQDMLDKIDDGLKQVTRMFWKHSRTTLVSVVYQMIAMNVMIENNEEFTSDHYHDVALLLATNSLVESAEVPVLLEEIASIIRNQGLAEGFIEVDPKDGVDWLKARCAEASAKLERFLNVHGHRVYKELELKELPWNMDPSVVIRMIQSNCKSETTTKKAEGLTVEQTIAKLVSPKRNITRLILKFIVRKCRDAVAIREKTKSLSAHAVQKIRIAYRRLALELVLQGYLLDEDLIFHFTHEELKQLIERHNPVLIAKATRRQRLFQKWNILSFPEITYGYPRPEQDDNENFDKIRKREKEIKVQGTPVSLGSVVARVSVICDIKDAVHIQPGDILITHSTDIAWSPYFPMLAGVVTELGGLISHGAVVAREYGLPCIVGAEKATKFFKTGDKVLLSGKTGIIELV